MRDNPKPYEIYKHFKGNQYQVLNIAKDSEDGHLVVVYQAMYGEYQVYVRDLDQFMSPVDKEKYPEVIAQYRFTKVGAEGACDNETGRQTAETDIAEREHETTTAEIKTGSADNRSDENTITDVKTNCTADCNDKNTTVGEKADPAVDQNGDNEDGFHLDPEVERFLDAVSYDEKLNILAGLRNRLTDDMLQIMSVSMDIELNSGSVDEKYKELRNCLLTKDKFEIQRRG